MAMGVREKLHNEGTKVFKKSNQTQVHEQV
jgi:hypothetical protein